MTHGMSGSSSGAFLSAPQSIPVFVAAISEPLLAVVCLLVSSLLLGQVLDRSVLLLCVFTMTLMFPGTNRFYEKPFNSAVDIVAAWVAVVTILGLCGYATDTQVCHAIRRLVEAGRLSREEWPRYQLSDRKLWKGRT